MSLKLFGASRPTPEIVVGADVSMTTSADGITLYAPGHTGHTVIGKFTSPADAWAALDALDAPQDLDAEYRAA